MKRGFVMQPRSTTDTYGVDLSAYQGTINWDKLKAQNIRFAILRCYGTDHTGTGDVNFERLVNEARTNGVLTGGYYFATPTPPLDLSQARSQAQQFVDKLQNGYGTGSYGDLTPFVDIEHNPYAQTGFNITDLGTENLVLWIQEFARYFAQLTGRKLGIYCGEWFMKDPTNMGFTDSELLPLASMPLWVAEYERYWSATRRETYPAPNNFGGWDRYVCWQFSDRGDGVTYGVGSQYVDLDVTQSLDELRIQLENVDVVAPDTTPVTDITEPVTTTEPITTTDPTNVKKKRNR